MFIDIFLLTYRHFLKANDFVMLLTEEYPLYIFIYYIIILYILHLILSLMEIFFFLFILYTFNKLVEKANDDNNSDINLQIQK